MKTGGAKASRSPQATGHHSANAARQNGAADVDRRQLGAAAPNVPASAYHEAGHAVAAEHFGWVVDEVTVDHVKAGPQPRAEDAPFQIAVERGIVALAGREAVWHFAETEPTIAASLLPAEVDWADAEQVAAVMRPTGRYQGDVAEQGDDLDLAELHVAAVCDNDAETDALLELCRLVARRLVRRHEAAIRALAERLTTGAAA